MNHRIGVSLFTGAGIGDVGFRAAGIDFVVMNELEPDRANIACLNFPTSEAVIGDIWDVWPDVARTAQDASATAGGEVFLLSITAPCQGMSKNGKGKLLNLVRDGKRPKLDQRNRLILPALEAVKAMKPRWVFFENVLEMANTLIEDSSGDLRLILDVIDSELRPEFEGEAYDLEFADYGVPQRRRRLLTIYTRSDVGLSYFRSGGKFVPEPTHAKSPSNGQRPWLSVTDAIADFPPLDASAKETAQDSSIPFHRVPLLDPVKYDWVSNTPASRSAFDNQCTSCGYGGNPIHGTSRNKEGINRANSTTPILCEKCGAVLPRPHVLNDDGTPRIMKGYTSAYKRMAPNLPAPALTRNLSYACSDQKIHPTENRVLSLAEAFHLHTLDKYDFHWGPVEDKRGRTRETAPDSLIRLVLGESIPPAINELVMDHILAIEDGAVSEPKSSSRQESLFAT